MSLSLPTKFRATLNQFSMRGRVAGDSLRDSYFGIGPNDVDSAATGHQLTADAALGTPAGGLGETPMGSVDQAELNRVLSAWGSAGRQTSVAWWCPSRRVLCRRVG
ncbi:MAG: hypothetical protein AAF328_05595 [Planctomycetota bacterium]